MAKRITQIDIININNVYAKCHNKAQTARETGFSPATVSKYIIENFGAQGKIEKKEREVLPLNPQVFHLKDWSELLDLSEEEREEMKLLRKEVYL